MEKCPYNQGVCFLDEDMICYSNSDSCDIYKNHLLNLYITKISKHISFFDFEDEYDEIG